LEYYHPIDGSGSFLAPGFIVNRTNFNSYEGPVRSTATRDRFAGSFYVGLGTWRFAQLRVGVLAGYDSYGKQVVTDGISARSEGFANSEVSWIYNTQDSGGFLTRVRKSKALLAIASEAIPFRTFVTK